MIAVLNRYSKISFQFHRNVPLHARFNPRELLRREDSMKKLGYAIAALGMIAVAAPSIASAETVVIKRGGHHDWDRSRAEYRVHRGWHEGWHPHRDKVVIIKHHRHYD
jgi:hypothetical protein